MPYGRLLAAPSETDGMRVRSWVRDVPERERPGVEPDKPDLAPTDASERLVHQWMSCKDRARITMNAPTISRIA